MVALTFDDGPDPRATPAVLQALRVAGAKATFFVVAEQIEGPDGPALLRAIRDGGHVIQAHCARHISHRERSAEEIAGDARAVLAALARHGVPAPRLWRPPYGHVNERHSCSVAANVGLQLVCWTHDTADYAGGSAADMLKAAKKFTIHNGSVILMHDSARYAHRREHCQATVDLIPRLVDHLRSDGHSLGQLVAPIAPRPILATEEVLLPCE